HEQPGHERLQVEDAVGRSRRAASDWAGWDIAHLGQRWWARTRAPVIRRAGSARQYTASAPGRPRPAWDRPPDHPNPVYSAPTAPLARRRPVLRRMRCAAGGAVPARGALRRASLATAVAGPRKEGRKEAPDHARVPGGPARPAPPAAGGPPVRSPD